MPSLERGQHCLLSAMLLCGRQVKGNVTFPHKTRRLCNNKTIWQLSSSMTGVECQKWMSRVSWTSEYPKEKEVKFSMLWPKTWKDIGCEGYELWRWYWRGWLGKQMTFISHYLLFPHSLPLFCKPTEPFCVNPLIRKTLTSIVPLHFGGKNISLIHPPRSNRRRAELRGALLGIRLCRGVSADSWVAACAHVSGDKR